ncbi:AfsR/SARP family transcriptional regulator [Streptomyces sp. ISL-11]|uniref:AfsR/SARP family transcriptional regulator n=1 Tax=Streptomyces sp. ISL-11 TaxID=2819174 RepID=UPI001BED2AE9|nr:AfsR/SARP family transcriptional regulator [Streptomyces sp. ISL-11]MBT2383348.1 winged helix-turn-helix domain-containing protein [Streptomyces sp. ISL-11]
MATLEHGSPQLPSAPKTRQLLALFLFNANAPVSVSQCIEELWGEDAPPTALQSIHTRVLQIRKFLANSLTPREAKRVLVTGNHSYTLRIGPGELDLHDLERQVRGARRAEAAADDRALSLILRDALDLWHGPVLADVSPGLRLQPHVTRLEEQRLTLREKCIDAELRLGLHQELLHELSSLIVQYPTHENFQAQHMLALYRSGRVAQALECYRTLRERLVSEVGIEPSLPLRALQAEILSQSAGDESALDSPEWFPGFSRSLATARTRSPSLSCK